MRRRVVHPYGQSISATRLVSLIMALAVLWLLYTRLKDPATWKAFAKEDPASKPAENAPPALKETIVPGPNHKNEDELSAAQHDFEYIIDKAPLKSREMDAYWRMMAWSRTEPLADLEQDAQRDVMFVQLFEQPKRHRGQPIRLRLHVNRVLEWDAATNSHGIKKVYEAWGWTDESSTNPYVVVFPERPEGLPLGEDKGGEVVFVGYLLKVMSYTDKLGKTRGAPLLIGRTRLVSAPSRAAADSDASTVLIVVLGGVALLVGIFIWIGMRPRKKAAANPLPGELLSFGSLDGSTPNADIVSNDTRTPEPSEVGQPVGSTSLLVPNLVVRSAERSMIADDDAATTK